MGCSALAAALPPDRPTNTEDMTVRLQPAFVESSREGATVFLITENTLQVDGLSPSPLAFVRCPTDRMSSSALRCSVWREPAHLLLRLV